MGTGDEVTLRVLLTRFVLVFAAWFALAVPSPAYAESAADFEEAQTSPEAADFPLSIARADFDGDGDQDLAVADFYDVRVLLNNGRGDFSRPPTSPERAGKYALSVTAADLDGDGDQDLAVVDSYENRISILLNNGRGDFSRPRTSPEAAGDSPESVVAADLDGDGDQDLAVANSDSDDVTTLLNDGAGDFSRPPTSPEVAGSGPFSVAAADLDGDGDQDLAVANLFSENVTILLNNGAGDFSQPPTSPEVVGRGASLAAADLDGDGDQDLAVADRVSNNVTILLNKGSGDFSQPRTSPEAAGNDPQSVTAADLDGDGDQDLAVANSVSDNVTILLNNGRGDFSQPRTSPEQGGNSPQSVVAADVDGDGDQDLAVASSFGGVTILLNRSRTRPAECTRIGTSGNDIIRGTSRDDVVCGGGGNDIIYGGGGGDTIRGGAGNDIIRGEAGYDRLFGGDGNDIVYGGDGDDRLNGGPGRDILSGQDGRDYLDTRDNRGGNDVAKGGAGDDDCDTDLGDARTSC